MSNTDFEKMAYTALLYDFYGALLTKKQSDILEMYWMQNLSLSEIAGILGITRQAASILINRTESKLAAYEKALHLVETHVKSKKELDEIISKLNDIARKTTDEGSGILIRKAAKKLANVSNNL